MIAPSIPKHCAHLQKKGKSRKASLSECSLDNAGCAMNNGVGGEGD